MLFVVALSAGYALAHWRQLLILVTAFTVVSVIGLALMEWRISVNVAEALAAQDLGTDAKIVSMDTSIADNKRTGEENAEDIEDLDERVKMAFQALLGERNEP